jgi:hypothetical protein
MKRRVLIAVLLGAFVAPTAALAESPPGPDRENAARACKALRASMGLETFRQTYGTAQSNRRNAFGRCVSRLTRTERLARLSARAECEAERNDPNFAASHDGKTFQQFYGTGPRGANAFGKCVSSKAKSLSAEERQDLLNAARQCKAERRSLGVEEFRAKYGTNGNDRNAFGKCVSKLANEND